MHGVLVVDKPDGMTSAQVVARVKRATGAGRVGHIHPSTFSEDLQTPGN